MSDISGKGYGDSHNWIRGGTNQVGSNWMKKATYYVCPCGVIFSHAYDIIPDIFEAMKQAGIPEKCLLKVEEPTV